MSAGIVSVIVLVVVLLVWRIVRGFKHFGFLKLNKIATVFL